MSLKTNSFVFGAQSNLFPPPTPKNHRERMAKINRIVVSVAIAFKITFVFHLVPFIL